MMLRPLVIVVRIYSRSAQFSEQSCQDRCLYPRGLWPACGYADHEAVMRTMIIILNAKMREINATMLNH